VKKNPFFSQGITWHQPQRTERVPVRLPVAPGLSLLLHLLLLISFLRPGQVIPVPGEQGPVFTVDLVGAVPGAGRKTAMQRPVRPEPPVKGRDGEAVLTAAGPAPSDQASVVSLEPGRRKRRVSPGSRQRKGRPAGMEQKARQAGQEDSRPRERGPGPNQPFAAGSGSGGHARPGSRKPLYLRTPRPAYPRLARSRGWQGVVQLLVTVDRTGQPVQVEIASSSGYPLLDRSALRAVRRWRFMPALRDGRPVRSRIRVPVRFSLTRQS